MEFESKMTGPLQGWVRARRAFGNPDASGVDMEQNIGFMGWLGCYRGQRPERADKNNRRGAGTAALGRVAAARGQGRARAAHGPLRARRAALGPQLLGRPQISLPQCAVNIAPEVLGSACISRPPHVLLIQQNLAASAPYSQSRKTPAGSLLIQRLTRLGRRLSPLSPAHARRGRWEGPCQFSPAAAAFMVRSASRRETRATQRPTSYGPPRRFFVSDRGRLCRRRCPTIRCTIWHETAP